MTIGLNICPDAEGNDTCKQGTFDRAQVVGEGVATKLILPSMVQMHRPSMTSISDSGDSLSSLRHQSEIRLGAYCRILPVGLFTETNELIEGLDLQELGYDDILDGEIKLDTESMSSTSGR